MRLYELNNLQPFKTDEYNTPNQMEIMANPDYWREKKGVVGGVQWMTPAQYIRACEIGFRNNGSEGLVQRGRNPDLIKKYASDMKRGDKFPMLELDYRNDYFGQEGLHRAMAAEEAGVRKLPVFIMKDSPEKESITEGLSSVLYHYTSVYNALQIVKQNKIKLAASPGTGAESNLQSGDRVYYLSTARHKLGGYHLESDLIGVIINLNGQKLGQRYKGKPVDYWGPEWYGVGRKGYEKKEAEDRIFSTEPYIPNATKYIQEIHIMFTKKGQEWHKQNGPRLRRLIIASKTAGIPTFVYDDSQAWLLQNKKKAVNPNRIDMIAKSSAKDIDQGGYHRGRHNDFSGWLELYYVNDSAKLTKNSNLQYKYIMDYPQEATSQLANEIHNNKTKPDEGLSSLLRIMRKEKLSTPQDFVDFLTKKWHAEYEVKRAS